MSRRHCAGVTIERALSDSIWLIWTTPTYVLIRSTYLCPLFFPLSFLFSGPSSRHLRRDTEAILVDWVDVDMVVAD